MERKLTCIVCPMGCSLTVDIQNNEVIEVYGNTCPRGKVYAINECTNPVRVVTTTMRCDNGKVIPVKTSTAIPKDKIFECMRIINNHICKLPVKVKDVIIKDVFGADIIATKNME